MKGKFLFSLSFIVLHDDRLSFLPCVLLFLKLIEDVENCEKSERKNVERKTYAEVVLGDGEKPKKLRFADEIPVTKVMQSNKEP